MRGENVLLRSRGGESADEAGAGPRGNGEAAWHDAQLVNQIASRAHVAEGRRRRPDRSSASLEGKVENKRGKEAQMNSLPEGGDPGEGGNKNRVWARAPGGHERSHVPHVPPGSSASAADAISTYRLPIRLSA